MIHVYFLFLCSNVIMTLQAVLGHRVTGIEFGHGIFGMEYEMHHVWNKKNEKNETFGKNAMNR